MYEKYYGLSDSATVLIERNQSDIARLKKECELLGVGKTLGTFFELFDSKYIVTIIRYETYGTVEVQLNKDLYVLFLFDKDDLLTHIDYLDTQTGEVHFSERS